MRDYSESNWGFNVVLGISGSVFPRALVMAVPSAIVAYIIAMQRTDDYHLPDAVVQDSHEWEKHTKNLTAAWGAFSTILFFLLQGRTNTAYSRWWEGGTLLQQVRGEWFNAYSSLVAFSSTDPKMSSQVEEFHHFLARLMSLLFCSGLQQVSPDRNKTFEVLDIAGIDQESLLFLHNSADKVEVILQWVQRSTILNMGTGVLPIPPPILSRAFQELSRGIVNLQNARKIAEFPYPFPNAQACMVVLIIHWWMSPFVAAMLLSPVLASLATFLVIFFVWSLNFIALQLERPFGERPNDLPMDLMQNDWNNSLATLLATKAQQPPKFGFDRTYHRKLDVILSDDVCCRGDVDNAVFERNSKRLNLPENSLSDIRRSTISERVEVSGRQEVASEAPRRESAKNTKSSRDGSKQIKSDRKVGGVKLIENVVMRLSEIEHANNSSAFIETCKEMNTSKPAMSEITATTQTGASSVAGGASMPSEQSLSRSGMTNEARPSAATCSADELSTWDAVSEEDAKPQEPGEMLISFKARMEAAHQRMLDRDAIPPVRSATTDQGGDSAGDGGAIYDPGRSLSRCSRPSCGIKPPPPRDFGDSASVVADLEP